MTESFSKRFVRYLTRVHVGESLAHRKPAAKPAVLDSGIAPHLIRG